MTRRDGDANIKMTRSDRSDSAPRKCSFGAENGADSRDDPSSPKSSTTNHTVAADNPRPRSASNSLPGSRASSRPGSQMPSRTNSQESIIDLFDDMTLAFGQNGYEGKGFHVKYPKPRNLSQPRWTWADKLRINSAIWRSWHIQFVKNKKPIGCHFDPQLPETRRPTLQADAIQSGRGTIGSIQYNQSQVGSVVRDYRKWRLYRLDSSKPPSTQSQAGANNAEDNAIDLNMPHPPLSPMSARTLANEDTLKDFSDTIFISSKKKHFSVPNPKKITRHGYNADIIQPGLMQLEPEFDDDFMETLDSLQEAISKTPTKLDLRCLIEFPESILNGESMGAFSEPMSLTTVGEESACPKSSARTPFPISIAPHPATVARSLSFTSPASSTSPSQSWGQVTYQMTPNQSQAGSFPQLVTAPSSVSYVQMPPIFEAVTSGPGVMAMQVDTTATHNIISSTDTNVYSTSLAKQQPYSPSMGKNQQCMNPGVDINDAIDIIAAQLQQQQQTSKMDDVPYNWNFPSQNQPAAGNDTFWKGNDERLTPVQGYSVTSEAQVSWPYSNLPQSMPSTGMNFSFAGASTPVSVTNGVFPIGIMSQGGLSSTNAAFIKNAGGLPHRMVADTMAPMDQSVVFEAAYSPQESTPSPGCTTPGQVTSSHRTSGQVTPGQGTPGQVTPGQRTPGHVTPGHVTPGHVTPGHVTPGHVTPGYVTPGHVTPGYVTPGHVTPGYVTPGHVTPGHMTPQLEESMEFEQFSFPQISKATTSTSSSLKIKRERSHSRKNSLDRSPRVSQTVMFADSTSYAAYTGKSETKDLGMPSPSEGRGETNISPHLQTSGHPSTASSAASSPGSVVEGTQFEFNTPQAKRRKTPDSGEKENRRRFKHLQSEHKRRFNIQSGLDEIQRLVPSLRDASDSNKSSTAGMLQKANEHIVAMKEQVKDLRETSEKLREDIELLNQEIDTCQDELPDSGAPVKAQSDCQLHSMLETYLNKKMKENWTFWIFSLVVRPLFDTYMAAVSSANMSDFDQVVRDWTEEYCRLKPLRKLVTSALTKVSRETSILMDPDVLPSQIREIIAKETDKNAHGKT